MPQCKYVGKGLPALQYLSRYLYSGVISEKNLIDFDRDRNPVTLRYRDSKSGEGLVQPGIGRRYARPVLICYVAFRSRTKSISTL